MKVSERSVGRSAFYSLRRHRGLRGPENLGPETVRGPILTVVLRTRFILYRVHETVRGSDTAVLSSRYVFIREF